jgi:hypothetical protein
LQAAAAAPTGGAKAVAGAAAAQTQRAIEPLGVEQHPPAPGRISGQGRRRTAAGLGAPCRRERYRAWHGERYFIALKLGQRVAYC